MFFDGICLKIYYWPFLSYLANIKGICPAYPGIFFPIITLPPGSTAPSTSIIPTFQPTPPVVLLCPTEPLACSTNGLSPLPNCPCIDPRRPNGQATSSQAQSSSGIVNIISRPPIESEFPNQIGQPSQLQVEGSEAAILSPLKTGSSAASEMIVFTSLGRSTSDSTRKRQRKRRTAFPKKASQACFYSHQRPGNCVGLSSCPKLIEDFYTDTKSQLLGIDFQAFVSDQICGFDGHKFLVCCPLRSAVSSHSSIPTAARLVSNTSQPNYDLSLGSLFQFAPLTTLSGASPVVFSSAQGPQQQQQPTIYATTTTTSKIGAPPVVLQPSPNIDFPTVLQPTPPTNRPAQGSAAVYPTLPPVVLSPAPSMRPSSVQGAAQPSTDCGISRGTTNRVVGGAETRRGAYPWMAALGYYDESDRNNLKFLCGGSLVSPRYVVTSAHCANPTLAVVRLGAHDLSRPLEPNAIDLKIKRTITHEKFDVRSIANDIALIELSTSAPMTDSIGSICLPEGNFFLSQDFVGMNPFTAGWGAIKHQGPTSNVLRDAQVPIVNRQTCEQSYMAVFRFIEFSEKLICAGNSNVDACQGDSGGPLMLPSQANGNNYRYYLLGVVSYGYECARSGFPGVYTRVASYVPWIKAHLT